MKKIIALILATVMVMLAVVACGETTVDPTTATTATTKPTPAATKPTTQPTTATTATTQATTTAKPVVIPDPYTAVCYLPTGENAQAVNVGNAQVVGTLTAGEGVELKGGYFYVVNVVPAEKKNTAVVEVGAAVETKKVTAGYALVNLKASSWLVKAVSLKDFDLNCYMDEAAFNTAMGETYANVGKFGTIKINSIDGDMTDFIFDGGDTAELLTDYKWNFVYVGYNGANLNAATGKTWTPLAMSAKEIILSSIDSARGEANGWSRDLWFTTTKNYGGVPSVTTTNGKFDGTTHQSYYIAEWQNSLIPVKYAAALKSYLALTDSEATIAANLAAANNALEAAQKALDDAIKANASVNELKVALDAALAALNEAKQVAFEAKVTHETEKAKNKNSTETADALAVRTEKEALEATAKATYDAAKAAFDAAVAADANLTALTTAVTDATAAQKTAQAPQTTVDNYKLYSTQNEKFLAAYNEIANVALWDTEDMDNSAIVKAFAEVAAENRLLPTFTYYYDAATDTYTVFVTSAVDANLVEKF